MKWPNMSPRMSELHALGPVLSLALVLLPACADEGFGRVPGRFFLGFFV